MVDCLRKFLKEIKIAGHVTKVLPSDGGMEFNCEALQRVFEEYGVMHRLAMPYTPEQNSTAEQENRGIVESARCMLHACELPIRLWAEASSTAVYILNRTGPAPVELWAGSYATLGSHACFQDRMFCALLQTEKSQVEPKEYVGSTGRTYG